jgi:uncharacterized membrane protein HdeD (DUF308 family)
MSNFPILDAFAKNWWVLLVRGLLALLFGAMAFAWPGATLAALVLLYGAYAFVDGVTAVSAGIPARSWWLVFSGLAGIAVGIGTFFYPAITAIALFYLIAGWAIVRGIFEIVAAIELRKVISGGWALVLGGIFSIIFGLLFAAFPAPGVLALAWLIGAYAVVFGAVMIVLSFLLHGLPGKLDLHAGRV